MPNLIRYNSKARICPVCDSHTKGCSHDSEAVGFTQGLYFCRGDKTSDEYRFIKTASLWSVYCHSSDALLNKEANRKEWLEQQEALRLARIEAQKKETQRLASLTTVKERDSLLTSLLNKLDLRHLHEKELLRRGLTPQQIKEVGFVSIYNNDFVGYEFDRLAGFKNGYYIGASGIVCPIQNVDGCIIGFQIKTNDAATGKYKWTRTGDTTAHLQSGELPLSVVNKGNNVGLCEGTLKPIVAAYKHGLKFIGASGGNFPSTQLKEALASSRSIFSQPITVFPDSGYLANAQVFNQLIKTINQVINLGYEVQVADWYQGLDKTRGDIDELENLDGVRYVSREEIEGFYCDPATYTNNSDFSKFLAWMNPSRLVKELAKKVNFKSRDINFVKVDESLTEYLEGTLPLPSDGNGVFEFDGAATPIYEEAIRKGYKHILDNSATGSGKTHSASNVDLTRCISGKSKLFYLTTQARNPSIEKLEALFTELPARNKGYDLVNSKRTAKGNPYRVATSKDVPDLDGNCHLADKFFTVRQKNTEADICGSCKFVGQCRTSKGKGFGFKSQLAQALSSDRLRGNPQGISESMVKNKTVLIVDEYSQSVQWSKVLSVSLDDVQSVVSMLTLDLETDGTTELLKFVAKVRKLLQPVKNEGYGLATKDILPLLGEIDFDAVSAGLDNLEVLIEEYNESIIKDRSLGCQSVLELALEKDWLRLLVEVVSGKIAKSSLRKVKGVLTISIINNRWLDVVNKAQTVIWQDATGNRSDLALRLGCKPDEILVVRQKQENHNNLEIVQLNGLGKATKDRSPELKKRIDVARKTLTEMHPDIGFIDFKQYSAKEDLNHFADAVGSNAYSNRSTVCSIGIPYPNISAIQLAYETYSGTRLDSIESLEFKLFYDAQVAAQIVQEIGRSRANRRPNDYILHYILADISTTFLTGMGYRVTNDHITNLSVECADRQSRARFLLKEAFSSLFESGQKLSEVTQSQVAEFTKTSQQNIAKLAKVLGGWENLKSTMAALIYRDYSGFTSEFGVLTDEVIFLAKSYLPLVFDMSFTDVVAELSLMFESYTEDVSISVLDRLDSEAVVKLLVLILNQLPWSYRQEYYALSKSLT
ncbi:MAG: hypothetical protein ACRC80_11875 [Waterburya sp.]